MMSYIPIAIVHGQHTNSVCYTQQHASTITFCRKSSHLYQCRRLSSLYISANFITNIPHCITCTEWGIDALSTLSLKKPAYGLCLYVPLLLLLQTKYTLLLRLHIISCDPSIGATFIQSI